MTPRPREEQQPTAQDIGEILGCPPGIRTAKFAQFIRKDLERTRYKLRDTEERYQWLASNHARVERSGNGKRYFFHVEIDREKPFRYRAYPDLDSLVTAELSRTKETE